ncbi:uncharacterized protein I303_100372 [Kwoniella dejecticola CBS 10117]|uniref:FHA domain-containing protein n=1 Tax=Kwoniella dejecticola CBS 10117 TaxID=1296121 RepID=A0A1A6AEQ7_9TREE|nr:uncharacterized protein I303_00372 [Kwoniella dejecticola CBS 10117]OBR88555.1 hypothetical protein I303_00372 [Kwoniella dejecticola CBS 10117]
MTDWTKEGSPMPSGPPPVTFGRLTLMKRKGGGDVQTIPLDAERITFGRDYDCDVRLYYSDVSKLHCEISFDIVSGKAKVIVKGTNGLFHTPSGGSAGVHKPPAEIDLSDNDVITIRKKPFRFEYGPAKQQQPTVPFSPAVHDLESQPIPDSPSGSKPRRRASHRLSLVPEGKTFVPLSPVKGRRQSTLGLGGLDTPAASRGNTKSKLSEQVIQEGAKDGEESNVDMANGDEGDKVYLEVNEEESNDAEELHNQKAIHENPFMTPQLARKAPMRNTSAVPRTRKLPSAEKEDEVPKTNSPVSKESPAPATPPKTPRSVPLPESAETPYNPPVTPSAKAASTPVPARVALSTPKGPATLRKALLLRSARKVWQDSREAGVEGAIQNGQVETRRKSISPKTRAGRKSTTPIPEIPVKQVDEDEDMSEEEREQEQEQEGAPTESPLQWVEEDGTAEVSFESESSGRDSFEADMSLDLPGQGVIEFALTHPEVEEEYINNDHADVDDDQEEMEVDVDAQSAEQVEEYEEYEQAVKLPADQSVDEDSTAAAAVTAKEEEDDEAMSLPGTPSLRQPLSKQFFTPQPTRNINKLPRRSLANIGAPPVRFERLPATPNTFKRGERAPPRSMGKPSRNATAAATDSPKVNVEAEEKKVFSTPSRSEASRAEARRRRESLATPRQLPAMPASGFKNPVVETRFADLVPTPSHPALLARSPEPEAGKSEQTTVPATPISDLKARLSKMRSQSTQRADRRATVGFALPTTPSRVGEGMGSRSVNPVRVAGRGPKTPIFPKAKKEDLIMESPAEENTQDKARLESSPEYETPSSPSTPSYTGIREMLRPALPAKTPDMSGLKTLFPATPQNAPSPSFVEIREMLRQPAIPATPNFSGVRDMYNLPKVAQTPGFEGIGEMFEEEEEDAVEAEVEEQVEEKEEEEIDSIIVVDVAENMGKADADDNPPETQRKTITASKVPRAAASSVSAPSRARKTTTSTEQPESASAPTRPTSKLPARKAAAPKTEKAPSKPSPSTKAQSVESVPEAVEHKSRSTRAKRTASVDPEPIAKASKSSSKSTKAKSAGAAEIESENQSLVESEVPSKSTRNRSNPTRSTRQATIEREEEKAEKKSKPSTSTSTSRGKKPLTQLPEQETEQQQFEQEHKSASSRSASTKSRLPTATTKKAATATKSASAPSRRQAVGNKENDDDAIEEKPVITTKTKKRVPSAGSQKVEEVKSEMSVPVTRATRSRK